jgi:predicted ATPase
MCYMPELLRVKGNLLLSLPQPSRENAEECFKESLALSRRQGASAWELRTAIDLAGLSASTGRRAEARALLQRLLGRFEDGSETSDIKEAERLLSTLN